MTRHKLKLTSLKFISSVDAPAQETATAVLFKRANAPLAVKATARVAKLSDELGLVFGWALTTKANGADYWDLHGDNIVEDDLIKVAAAFMENGGAADTNHDRQQDGRVVFAMPLTAEVAKAFGIQTDTHGLMIAIKPSAEDYQAFKRGELTGFSIDGTGERTPASLSKSAIYTTEVDGHAHTIELGHAGECGWYTSYQNAAGSTAGHSHAVMRDANGALVILADSGHTHEVAEGQPAVIVVPENTVIVVENAAPLTENTNRISLNSTPSLSAPNVESTMKLVVLTEAQHAHYQKLAPADAEAFVAKSASDRDAEVAKAIAADPVVFKGEKTGIEVRKSQGDFALQIAKQAETMAVTSAKQAEEIAKRDTEIKKARIRKTAAEILKNAPGDDETHDFIVEQLEGNEKAMAALKGLVSESRIGKAAPGQGGTEDPVQKSATEQLDTMTLEYAKSNNVDRPTARVAVLKTAEGKRLYAESVGRA